MTIIFKDTKGDKLFTNMHGIIPNLNAAYIFAGNLYCVNSTSLNINEDLCTVVLIEVMS